MEDILQKVTEFARKAHGDQRRKFVDEPYINHPVRVMEICRPCNSNIEVLVAALLHDVLEDTPVTREEIKDFLSGLMDEEKTIRTVKLVEELTDIYTKKEYPGWNRRKRLDEEAARLSKTSSESQTIKYADIIDNSMDIHGSNDEFAIKFLQECKSLLKVLTAGDDRLRQKAVDTVQRCIDEQNNNTPIHTQ
jgi:guanosine-3',5'-bis(diphosphate) 3'-pyrophosphohydrolase